MTNVNIVELDNALVVQTERTPSLVEGFLSAVATAVFVGIAGSFVVGKLLAAAWAVLAASIGFFFVRRTHKFELRVTRREFAARGKVGDNPGNSRSVPTSDVQWLEYQEDTTGPETAHHPDGLYAILKYRSVCLLPDVDEQQTAAVIERIKDKYPDLGTRWSGHSSFGRDFISLGLNDEPR